VITVAPVSFDHVDEPSLRSELIVQVKPFPMPAPAAPNHIHVEPRHFAVHERDARLAGAATALEVKIARAKLRPGGVSETGHRSQSQESGQQTTGKPKRFITAAICPCCDYRRNEWRSAVRRRPEPCRRCDAMACSAPAPH
jgi:hypothetical protein